MLCLHVAGHVSFTQGVRQQESGEAAAEEHGKQSEESYPWLEAFEAAKANSATEAERTFCSISLAAIRSRYGDSSDRLIAMLLTFDSLFSFRR
eukprot:5542740-Pleurochrysis_carterae.AAC.1